MKNSPDLDYEMGSKNVFADLGMQNAEEKLAKTELIFKINQLIKEKELTQKQAAKLLSVDQAKISLLHRGCQTGFSMERLIRYLSMLDQDIEIIIRPHLTGAVSHLRVLEVQA